jgi:hypothetical protein
MATCDACNQEMTTADACSEGIALIPLEVIQSGLELTRCHDCGVAPGGTHHPGCDVERCGACGHQAISCGCGQFDDDQREELQDELVAQDKDPEEIATAIAEREAQAKVADEQYWAERVNNRWAGVWPGALECHLLGYYCRDLHLDGEPASPERPLIPGGDKMQWHVPCAQDDEGAHADLNRWHAEGCPTVAAIIESNKNTPSV